MQNYKTFRKIQRRKSSGSRAKKRVLKLDTKNMILWIMGKLIHWTIEFKTFAL